MKTVWTGIIEIQQKHSDDKEKASNSEINTGNIQHSLIEQLVLLSDKIYKNLFLKTVL